MSWLHTAIPGRTRSLSVIPGTEARPSTRTPSFSTHRLPEAIRGGGFQNSSPRFRDSFENAQMKSNANPVLDRFRARLSEMTALHLQARHLPHVRRYHAQRERAPSRAKTQPDMGRPRRCWTLPLHLTDPSKLDSFADATEYRGGWLHFLDWGNGLLGIAEIQKKPKKTVLLSLSIGSSASAEHAVLARFLQSKVRYRNLLCIAVPALHFRALSFVKKKTGKVVILPLYSAIAPLQRGRHYSSETIQERLKAALEHRLKCARENLERRGRPIQRPSP